MKASLLFATIALLLAAVPAGAQQRAEALEPTASVLPATDSSAPTVRTIRVRGNRSRLGSALGAVAGITVGAVIGAQRYAGKPKSPGACYDTYDLAFCTRPILSSIEAAHGTIRGGAIGGLIGAVVGGLIGSAIPAWRDRVALSTTGVHVRF